MSRKTASCAALLAVLVAGPARADDADKAKRDALVASEWFKKGGWTDELAKAKAESKKSGKAIFVYFTVTNQDSPFCRNLEKDLFSGAKFLEWAKGFVCYCQITASKDAKLDELHKAQGKAWPWFAFLDSSGDLIYALRPTPMLEAFTEAGERVTSYVEVGRKAQKGGDAEKRDLVIAALDLGRIKVDDALARLEKLGALTASQKKAFAQAESNAFISEIANSTDPTDKEAIHEAGRKFTEHRKAGKPLPSSIGDFQSYWIAILGFAVEEKDAALYEEGLKLLKERFGKEPLAKPFFDSCDKTLAELKAEKK
jgi:hypothetical protein